MFDFCPSIWRASPTGGIDAVAAHHSTAMFDHSKVVTISGTLVEMRRVNPHVSLSVNGAIKQGDEPTLWLVESTSPGNLIRRGWTRTALKPGSRVQVELHPLRESDRKGGALVKSPWSKQVRSLHGEHSRRDARA